MTQEVERSIKKRKVWFRVFLILGLLGIASIATKGMVPFGIFVYPFGINENSPVWIFGVLGTLRIILDLSIIYLIIAFIISRGIKKLQNNESGHSTTKEEK